jgi:hypothetical protein
MVLVAALCLGAGSPFAGEAADPMVYGKGNPADWPKDKDALIAAPRNHKILLENDRVRVLDVTVAPGEVEAVHSHRWPSVLYFMAAGDFIDRDSTRGAALRREPERDHHPSPGPGRDEELGQRR